MIVGVVLLIAAISFEGYIAALMVMALGGCTYAGARELKNREAKTTRTEPQTDRASH